MPALAFMHPPSSVLSMHTPRDGIISTSHKAKLLDTQAKARRRQVLVKHAQPSKGCLAGPHLRHRDWERVKFKWRPPCALPRKGSASRCARACVWRTSATRNMNLSAASRRAMTAQSEMKTVRARFLGVRDAREDDAERDGVQQLPPDHLHRHQPCRQHAVARAAARRSLRARAHACRVLRP